MNTPPLVAIEFDRADGTYTAGEEITGTIILDCSDPTPVDDLVLEIAWRCGGRKIGAMTRGVGKRTGWWSAKLEAGNHRVPFTTKAPSGLPTYKGESFSLSWWFRVRADIPWAVDSEAEVPFTILAPITEPERGVKTDGYRQAKRIDNGASHHDRAALTARATGSKAAHFFSLGAAMLGAGLLLPVMQVNVWPVYTGGAVVLATFLFFRAIRLSSAKKSLGGDILASAVPSNVAAGGEVTAQVLFTPPNELVVEKATVELVGKEVAVRGNGSSTQTFNHTVHEHIEVLAPPGTIWPGASPVDLSCNLKIPDAGPASFSVAQNSVRWEVRFKIDGEGSPAWEGIQQLVVTLNAT